MIARKPNLVEVSQLLDAEHMDSETNGIGIDNSDPVVETTIRLNLEQLVEYDRNPRRAQNAEYDSLKESLRATGAASVVLVVTKRPGERCYFPKMGGNTRIHALKDLYAEAGNEKYFWLDCKFQPYTSEADLLICHLAENDNRADYIFLDRARGVRAIQEQLEAADGTHLSQRAFIERLSELGYKLSRRSLQRFDYAIDNLYLYIPKALEAGMVEFQASAINSLHAQLGKFRTRIFKEDEGISQTDLDALFRSALADLDDEAGIDPENLEAVMLQHMSVAISDSSATDDATRTEERLKSLFAMYRQYPDATPEFWIRAPDSDSGDGDPPGPALHGTGASAPLPSDTLAGDISERTAQNREEQSQPGGDSPGNPSPGAPIPIDPEQEKATIYARDRWNTENEQYALIRRDAFDAALRIARYHNLTPLMHRINKGYGFYIDGYLGGLNEVQMDIWWWLFRLSGLAPHMNGFIQVVEKSNYAILAKKLEREPSFNPEKDIGETVINTIGDKVLDRLDREVFLTMSDEAFKSLIELMVHIRKLRALHAASSGAGI